MAEITKITEATETAAPVSAAPAVPELVVKLRKPFEFDGIRHEEIDFSGMAKLTAADAAELDENIIMRNDTLPGSMPLSHPYYMQELAGLASGLPAELFIALPIRDMARISDTLNDNMGRDDNSAPSLKVRLQDGLILNGKKVTELDLTDMEYFSGVHQQEAERYAKKQPGGRVFQHKSALRAHQSFHFYLAAKAAGCSPRALEALSYRDAIAVRLPVTLFLADII